MNAAQGSEPGELGEARRAFLLAALSDTEGTIRATDTKASIALVVHGFIFTGLVGVLSRLTPSLYEHPCFTRTSLVVLTGLTAIAFLASIIQLLRCVRPASSVVLPDLESQGAFYLPGEASAMTGRVSGLPSAEKLQTSMETMTTFDIDRELIGELLKVSAIRARKMSLAGGGLTLLGLEVVLATALLVLLGLSRL